MAVFLDAPVDISPATTGSWQTVDLDTYIASLPSDVSGVMLKFIATSPVAVGARKTGSTDNLTQSNYYCGTSLFTGCDASHQVDIYRGTTGVTVYAIGYFTADATFFTNAYNKSPSTTSAWVDVDCSTEIPAGAVAAIFDIKAPGIAGLRNNGSTDNRTSGSTSRCGAIVGIDANRVCEFYTTVASGTLYLVGYLSEGVFKTNGVDVSLSTTGSYVDIDRSADTDAASAVGVVVEVKASVDQYYGVRQNGFSGDSYMKVQYKEWGVSGLDSNKVFEGKINHAAVDFFVIGYLAAPSSGGQTYTEPLTALAESYAAVTDIAIYLSAAEAIITAGVSATDTVQMLEGVLAAAESASSATDVVQRVEALLATIQAVDSVQDAAALVEAVITSTSVSAEVADNLTSAGTENVTTDANAVITVADVQQMQEQILTAAGVEATVADSVASSGTEALTTTATAEATVQDIVQMLEQVYTAATAEATVNDAVVSGVGENLLTSATAITSATDVQLMVDNLTIMVISGASLGEIAGYLEQLATAATVGASVSDVLLTQFIGTYIFLDRLPPRLFTDRLPSRSFIDTPRGRA